MFKISLCLQKTKLILIRVNGIIIQWKGTKANKLVFEHSCRKETWTTLFYRKIKKFKES